MGRGGRGSSSQKNNSVNTGTQTRSSAKTKVQTVDRKQFLDDVKQAPVFKKQGQVQARLAKADEEIVTLIDGEVETTNTANPGDFVVTNPGGEQYIVSSDTFLSRYEQSEDSLSRDIDVEKDATYTAKGYCRAITNPIGSKITMEASWGEMQNGDADCLIATTCDANGELNSDNPYIIAPDAFAETYKAVE